MGQGEINAHSKIVPTHVKKPGAFFVNAQLTIKSVREMVLQLGLHSCTRDLTF
jgi:hypothetical protein